MAIVLKSPREIELMRAAGRIVRKVLTKLEETVRPGVTTGELGRIADEMISAAGGSNVDERCVGPHGSWVGNENEVIAAFRKGGAHGSSAAFEPSSVLNDKAIVTG